jgi:hypothetical protein
MRLRKLAKDPRSGTGDCPAVYVAADDPTVMVIQGKHLDAETAAELHDPHSYETAVRISTESVLLAVEIYPAVRGEKSP